MFLKCCHLMIDLKGLEWILLFCLVVCDIWLTWICHKFCYWGWGMWWRILELCKCWLNFWDNLMWRYYFENPKYIVCSMLAWTTERQTSLATSKNTAQLWCNEMSNILQHFNFGGHIVETLVFDEWKHDTRVIFHLKCGWKHLIQRVISQNHVLKYVSSERNVEITLCLTTMLNKVSSWCETNQSMFVKECETNQSKSLF